jgi:hypothetical protein
VSLLYWLSRYWKDAYEMHTVTKALSPRKAGRPAAETPAQRVERLERELQAARAAARENERARDAVVGRAMREEAQGDGAFNAKVLDILRRRVTSAAEKALIAPLLV